MKTLKEMLAEARLVVPEQGPAQLKKRIDADKAEATSLGVTGTPGIVTDKGDYLAGYASAAHLASYLDEPEKVAGRK